MNRENRELTFVNIEATGFQDICDKLAELEKENKQLQQDLKQVSIHEEMLVKENNELLLENQRLNRMKRGLMLNNSRLTTERNDLQAEVDRLNSKLNNVTLWDLSPEAQEEAGHMLARDLLGKPMSKVDIEEEKMIADGEAHYERFAFLGDDF